MASPQLQLILDAIRSRPRPSELSVPDLRAGFDAFGEINPPLEGTTCEPVDAGGVPGEWIAPAAPTEGRTLLHLHGGGYVIGSIASHRGFTSRLAAAARARALLIDYRLAPEHPYPAALDDALAAYRWLLAQGIDPARLVVVGDSAGGGLAAATLLALRDAGPSTGEGPPAAAVLISAWLDLTQSGGSMASNAERDPIISREALDAWGAHYAGAADAREPLVSPLFGDLRGLPPLLLHVSTAETLLDDSMRFAERAREAGVDVTVEPWDDMLHVWHMYAQLLPEGQQAIDRIGAWVRERTGGG